ncbi:MAG TPA: hypothetical protein VHE23_02360 [Candidatus Acidoferrales bacterium]|nr:hypothetical protein [Candidatus Acidoferrales bacterium]
MAGLPERPTANLTRRGSLAYYLAAWVCGTFFFTAARIIGGWPQAGAAVGPARTLFFFYFLGLTFGWAEMLLFALLLRMAARALRWRSALGWMTVGGVTAALLGLAASAVPERLSGAFSWLRFLGDFFARRGADGLSLNRHRGIGAVLVILAGAATAFVLFLVEKAFTAPEEASK